MNIESFFLIAACLALGWIVARVGQPSPTLSQALNWWVINVALPALVMELIPHVRFDSHLWFLPVSMWLVFLGGWGVAVLVGRWLHWTRERVGAVALCAGLGNTALVGFPLIEALRGREALPLAAFTDQLGCCTALAVGGITISALYSGQKPEPRVIIRRVLLFPAFLGLIAGFIAGAAGGWPTLIETTVARIGATLTPVALFSIGLQLRLHLDRSRLSATAVALGWKLAIAPILIHARDGTGRRRAGAHRRRAAGRDGADGFDRHSRGAVQPRPGRRDDGARRGHHPLAREHSVVQPVASLRSAGPVRRGAWLGTRE